jgi:hypothetical protein
MLELLKHWVNEPGPPRIAAIKALRDWNLLFIGVIKTATKQYPISHVILQSSITKSYLSEDSTSIS